MVGSSGQRTIEDIGRTTGETLSSLISDSGIKQKDEKGLFPRLGCFIVLNSGLVSKRSCAWLLGHFQIWRVVPCVMSLSGWRFLSFSC